MDVGAAHLGVERAQERSTGLQFRCGKLDDLEWRIGGGHHNRGVCLFLHAKRIDNGLMRCKDKACRFFALQPHTSFRGESNGYQQRR
jgi:hypothetical protein